MKFLANAYDRVKTQGKHLFNIVPTQTFSCYDVPLGELKTKPSLGSPASLMREIYAASLQCVESAVGPEGVPRESRRGEALTPKASSKTEDE